MCRELQRATRREISAQRALCGMRREPWRVQDPPCGAAACDTTPKTGCCRWRVKRREVCPGVGGSAPGHFDAMCLMFEKSRMASVMHFCGCMPAAYKPVDWRPRQWRAIIAAWNSQPSSGQECTSL